MSDQHPTPCLIQPDLDFVRTLKRSGADTLKKCYQCSTCTVACQLAPDRQPFPRREMIWAQWGLKDRLLSDPDVWLCHHCGDCSRECPRGARPGDVMAAIRQEGVRHYAVPRFLARWASQPRYLPLLLLIPAVLLGLAVLVRNPLEKALGISKQTGEKIVFSTLAELPHWLLIGFFAFFSILALIAVLAGAARFWRAMASAEAQSGTATPAKNLGASLVAVLKSVATHDKFTKCTTERGRFLSHLFVVYGFLALFVVALWVIAVSVTATLNPLHRSGFAYPFSFWNPWRMLANLGGAALVVGCLLMIRDRLRDAENARATTYFDWAFLGTLLLVALTGFAAEGFHYARMVPHREIVYVVHLMLVFALLMYLPYSKFAHLVYRTTAMVYAEHSGRDTAAPKAEAGATPEGAPVEKPGAEERSD